jgi:hypothetical protein
MMMEQDGGVGSGEEKLGVRNRIEVRMRSFRV